MPAKKSSLFTRLTLILLIIVGAIIRIYGVNEYYYSADELMYLGISKANDLYLLLKFSLHETHPPLLFILAHYWIQISSSISFVRGLSLLAGLLLIPVYYLVGKKLNGEITGLFAATLATFSNGLVIQSYVLRDYSVFLLFLSVGYYYYLCWREQRAGKYLALYFLFSLLACATHFSAIFAVFVIAAVETLNLLQRKAIKRCISWCVINIIIAVLWCGLYFIYNSSLSSLAAGEQTGWYALIGHFFLYNIYALDYVYGYVPAGAILLVAFFIYGRIKDRPHRTLLYYLAFAALFLFSVLTLGKLYWPTGRHNLWLTPLIIPFFAVVIDDLLVLVETDFPGIIKLLPSLDKLAVILWILTAGLTFNQQQRFADKEEYMTSNAEINALTAYLKTLDNKSLIITERDDAVLLGNIYPYITGRPADIIMMPYGKTRAVFSGEHRRMLNTDAFSSFARTIHQRNMDDSSGNIVFIKTRWTGGGESLDIPITEILLCHKITKKIVALPDAGHPLRIDSKNIFNYNLLILTISKQDFLDHIAVPASSRESCFSSPSVIIFPNTPQGKP